MDRFKQYEAFEHLVEQVLVQLGYKVQLSSQMKSGASQPVFRPDMLAFEEPGVVRPVEIKLYRREVITLRLLREACGQVANFNRLAVGDRPLLIFSSAVDEEARSWAEEEFGVEIWDRARLLEKAGSKARSLSVFLEELDTPRAEEVTRAVLEMRLREAIPPGVSVAVDGVVIAGDDVIEPPPELKAKSLVKKLAGIKPGRDGAKDFEEVCREIVEYVFDKDLLDGRSQKRTADGLNIYDLVYRVRQSHPFWVTLTRDFRSRVILFECKNYGSPIGPAQVYTTERYLTPSALRPICFVISRKPANAKAVIAAFGTMRESGKLLVFLSDKDMVKMLHAKDAQLESGGSEAELRDNDPTEILDQRIYEFLAAMPR